jgi:hypothetical protein
LGLLSEPWLFLHTHDRLAWVCLNDSKPLSKIMEISDRRTPGGHFVWDWGLLPYHDFPLHPWWMYIPLRSDSMRNGTHGWVFRKLSKESQFDPSHPPGLLRLHSCLKANIGLTLRVACFNVLRSSRYIKLVPQFRWIQPWSGWMRIMRTRLH